MFSGMDPRENLIQLPLNLDEKKQALLYNLVTLGSYVILTSCLVS